MEDDDDDAQERTGQSKRLADTDRMRSIGRGRHGLVETLNHEFGREGEKKLQRKFSAA